MHVHTHAYIFVVMTSDKQTNPPTQTLLDVQNMLSVFLLFTNYFSFSSLSVSVKLQMFSLLLYLFSNTHTNTLAEMCIFNHCFMPRLCYIFAALTTQYRTCSPCDFIFISAQTYIYILTLYVCACACVLSLSAPVFLYDYVA